jgi:HEPN domain-containing protein
MACYLSVSAITALLKVLLAKRQRERRPLTIDIPVDAGKIGQKADDG